MMTLEILIGVVGIVVFTLAFIAGILAVSRPDKSL
jgi:hypothetical protein